MLLFGKMLYYSWTFGRHKLFLRCYRFVLLFFYPPISMLSRCLRSTAYPISRERDELDIITYPTGRHFDLWDFGRRREGTISIDCQVEHLLSLAYCNPQIKTYTYIVSISDDVCVCIKNVVRGCRGMNFFFFFSCGFST